MFQFFEADITRFIEKCELADGPLETQCWIWIGGRSRGQGNQKWYGTFWIGEKSVRAHKFSFVAIGRGTWVPGHHLDHLCNNSLCVNPKHLEMTTKEINQDRKYKRKHDHKH